MLQICVQCSIVSQTVFALQRAGRKPLTQSNRTYHERRTEAAINLLNFFFNFTYPIGCPRETAPPLIFTF